MRTLITMVALLALAALDAAAQDKRNDGGPRVGSEQAAQAGRKHVGQVLRGKITDVNDKNGQIFTLALDKPLKDRKELRVWCNKKTVVELDGKPSTFAAAVKVGRVADIEHVRGATPWVSVTSESPK